MIFALLILLALATHHCKYGMFHQQREQWKYLHMGEPVISVDGGGAGGGDGAATLLSDKVALDDDARQRQQKRDVYEEQHMFQKMRVFIDDTFLDPAWDAASDANGEGRTCYEGDAAAGAWKKVGRPEALVGHSASGHTPACEDGCDTWSKDAIGGGKVSGCNCYFQCAEEDELTSNKTTELQNIFAKTKALLDDTFLVRRLSNNSLPFQCSRVSTTLKGNCGCGNEYVPLNVSVGSGDSMLDKYTYNAQYDLVLFLTARTTRFLTGETLAFACACHDDWYFRSTYGFVNWGPNNLATDNPEKDAEQFGVAVHEISHALGFTFDNLPKFIRNDTVYNSSLPNAQSFTLPNSSVTAFEAAADVSVSADRGDGTTTYTSPTYIWKIVTPSVVEVAKAHFNCPTLTGVELENQGGEGTARSHWEKRLFDSEYMTGSSSYDPIFSELTLALFEDSGWYRTNRAMAGELRWYTAGDPSLRGSLKFGRNEGCLFTEKTCDKWVGPYYCTKDESKYWGCTPDRYTRGICTSGAFTSDLEPFWRYYPDEPKYGGQELADYCPFFKYNELLVADCRNPAHQARNLFTRGEVFAATSRCFDSTLLSVTKKGLLGSGGCHAVKCSTDTPPKLSVRIAYEWYECTEPGKEIYVDDYNGRVKCPTSVEMTDMCADLAVALPSGGLPTAPAVTAISPTSGAPDDAFELTVEGTNLLDVVTVHLGYFLCPSANFTQAPTATKLVCKGFINTATETAGEAIPGVDVDTTDVKNFFLKEPESKNLDARVDDKYGQMGVLADVFENDAARLVSSSALLLPLLLLLLLL